MVEFTRVELESQFVSGRGKVWLKCQMQPWWEFLCSGLAELRRKLCKLHLSYKKREAWNMQWLGKRRCRSGSLTALFHSFNFRVMPTKAEAAVASHGWCILRLKAWNVVLEGEKCWTIELFIRIVLFLDLETVLFGRLKLNIAAHPLNWNPCFLLDSSCIQHILGEKDISLCKGQFISALAMFCR